MNKNLTISNPKKILEGKFVGLYACEVYLPDITKNNLIYADSPDEATKNANIFVEVYLQEKIIGIENLLKEKEDIRKKLTEKLDGTKRNLAEHELKTKK